MTQKTPIRRVNDHLAQAWADAKAMGNLALADAIERQWQKAAVAAEAAETQHAA